MFLGMDVTQDGQEILWKEGGWRNAAGELALTTPETQSVPLLHRVDAAPFQGPL